jgi:hypothetical protein
VSRTIAPVGFYLQLIDTQFPGFKDDGLSFFPDWIYSRWGLWRAGRVHDWAYCTRCHKIGTMDQRARRFADKALRQHARELLPWYLRIAPLALYFGVRTGGGAKAWNSCGYDAGAYCRHAQPRQPWQVALEQLTGGTPG